MANELEIGSDLRLYYGNEGRSDFLLISAHGLQIPANSFRVPNSMTLHYYAPRREFLRMNITDYTLGSKVVEFVSGGAFSPNYILSKFQGRHGGGEGDSKTDENENTLKSLIDRTRKNIKDGVPRMNRPEGLSENSDLWKETLASYENTKKEYENLIPFDFLTVRNRYKMGVLRGNTLNRILNQVVDAGLNYPFVFGSFCRGMIPGIDRTHDIESHH